MPVCWLPHAADRPKGIGLSSQGENVYSPVEKEPMAKKDEIEVEGKVLEALPNAMFKVEIDEQHQVLAVLSGKIRMNFVRIVPGDKVKVVLSPYDFREGRITWRVKS